MPLRVWIADADPVVRAGLERVSSTPDIACASPPMVLARPSSAEGSSRRAPTSRGSTSLSSSPRRAFRRSCSRLPATRARRRAARPRRVRSIEKPCARAHVLAALERARRFATLEHERARLAEELAELHGAALIGGSPALRRLDEQLERAARTPRTTVLLRGEPGVEKELVARALHRSAPQARSSSAARPRRTQRSSNASSSAGRALGARAARGSRAAAEGGTLYLDDIDHVPLAVQGAAAAPPARPRVPSRRQSDGGAELRADVRLVAGTGGRLEEQVERGAFREDLFYRINVLSLVVPALRERGDDVVELARDALRRKALACGRAVRGFTPAAEALLAAHRWPGNVRELENVVQRRPLRARERIDAPDLALHGAGTAAPAGEFLPLGDRSLRALETALDPARARRGRRQQRVARRNASGSTARRSTTSSRLSRSTTGRRAPCRSNWNALPCRRNPSRTWELSSPAECRAIKRISPPSRFTRLATGLPHDPARRNKWPTS